MERYLNEHRLSRDVCTAMTRAVTYVHTAEESKKLDQNHFPKIILAASGMATGGRVLHHLAHLAGDHRNAILFTGFQAGGTRGDRITRGEKEIKIHGEIVQISAEVAQLHSVSAHADYQEILGWLGHLRHAPKTVFITHGEPSASDSMRKSLLEAHPDWVCEIPTHLQSVTL